MRFSILFAVAYLSVSAHAVAPFPIGRLYVGRTSVDPKALNTEMTADGLGNYSGISKAGIEVTFPLLKVLGLGLRFEKQYESIAALTPASSTTTFSGSISQDIAQAVARISIVNTNIFRVDAIGAYGGSNTVINVHSLSQTGKMNHTGMDKWSNAIVSSVGASIGAGFKGYYFYVEGGQSINKVKKFDRTGNLNANVDELDLSGPYINVGLIFDGSTIKMSGSGSSSSKK